MALLNSPFSVAVDTSNVYIADTQNGRIRSVSKSNGIITTKAGGGTSGDGPATSAQLTYPVGVAVDISGNMFIADAYASKIFRIPVGTGNIETIAGRGSFGLGGDLGAPTSASFIYPYGIAVDSSGNVYVNEAGNRKFPPFKRPTLSSSHSHSPFPAHVHTQNEHTGSARIRVITPPCPAGTTGVGLTCVTPCPAGFTSQPNSASCTPCAAGTYTATAGATTCTPCPAGKTSTVTGSTSVASCVPAPGYTQVVRLVYLVPRSLTLHRPSSIF